MSRISTIAALSLLASLTFVAWSAEAADGQTKSGVIKSVDVKASSFEVTLPARPLTFKVNDKTVITLDGKASTFEAAVKPDLKVAVTYSKSGDDRLASKIEVTSVAEKK